MKSRRRCEYPQLLAFLAIAGFLLLNTLPWKSATAAPGEPDKDPQLPTLLHEARRLIDTKQPAATVEGSERIIAAYQSAYNGRKEHFLCARSSAESLLYLLEATKGKRTAVVLSSTWADAWFLKGYALLELGRRAEAKTAIERALALSPASPLYLCELGAIRQMEKDWPAALALYEKAESHAALSPDAGKAAELGQARRGAGYTLIELGRLAEAEKKYEQCLADDPKDIKAQRELAYVRAQRAKVKSP